MLPMPQDSRGTPDLSADVEAVNRIPIVQSILEVVCRTTGMGFSAVARVTESHWVACSVRDEIHFGLKPGGELQLETTICNEIRQSGDAVVIDHVAADECWVNHHTPATYGFQSYISVPIRLKNGAFFGTLCAIDPKPAMLNRPEIVNMFNLFSELISFHLDATDTLTLTEGRLEDGHVALTKQEQLNLELELANHELQVIRASLEAAIGKLTDSEERLKQAIDTGRMGTWSIDPFTHTVTVSYFIRQMFGLPEDGPVTIEMILEAIHPQYHKLLADAANEALNGGKGSDVEYCFDNLVTGETKWARSTGRAFVNSEGKPVEYSGLFMDITERKLDDLRKNDFIGMVSHELKTPLTSLSAYVQLLHAKALRSEDEFTRKALDKAILQIKKMSTMINGFLDVSRLESGKINLNKTSFSLHDLVLEMVNDARMTVTRHQITLNDCEGIYITADRDKIGSVISNLLSNAVKYSPKGEVIEISCEPQPGSVVISIRDEGMGIKPDQLEKLFDRFYRVETKHTQHISGFGIGLYLSAEIVKRHDGTIWAESETGKGSTFYFSLPLTAGSTEA